MDVYKPETSKPLRVDSFRLIDVDTAEGGPKFNQL